MHTAQAVRTATATTTRPPDITVDLPAGPRVNARINRFVEARLAKKSAEDEYDIALAELKEIIPFEGELKPRQRLLCKMRGITRVILFGRERTTVDAALLMEAFPEAFEICQKVSSYVETKTV